MVLKNEADAFVPKSGQSWLIESERVFSGQAYSAGLVGRSSVPAMYRNVLFPEPLGPTITAF